MSERDYSKFLTDEGKLNVRLLPRNVYTEIVTCHRHCAAVIQDVFEEFYFAWDLEQKLKQRAEQAGESDIATAADEVMGEMDDSDWWRVMEAFEKRTIASFKDHIDDYADLIDPVYDDQELNGWRRLQ